MCLFTSPWLHKEYFHSGEVEVSPYLPKSLSYKADIFIFVSNVGQTKQLSLCQKLLASACNTNCVLQTYEIQRTFFRIPKINLVDSSNCPKNHHQSIGKADPCLYKGSQCTYSRNIAG